MSEQQAGKQGRQTTWQWSEDDVLRVLVNPSAVEGLFPESPGVVPESEWVRANASTIREIGPERWLRALLEVLRG